MNQNIEVFNDTQRRIQENETLKELTKQAVSNTKIYNQGFRSSKSFHYDNPKIYFEENLTLIPAFLYANSGKKTAVLNFANSVEPGGGVLGGADAQEEYLCRASNLYNCLTSQEANPYYQFHNELACFNSSNTKFLASDRIVYSPNVTFFKKDVGYVPDNIKCTVTQEYTDEWATIDVITCAAPLFSNISFALPAEELQPMFEHRIVNILEVAIENEIHSIVLGAFGCGAFHNPPMVVANAFHKTFMEERYRYAFEDVVFAVKRRDYYCENIEAFEIAFSQFPATGDAVVSRERNRKDLYK